MWNRKKRYIEELEAAVEREALDNLQLSQQLERQVEKYNGLMQQRNKLQLRLNADRSGWDKQSRDLVRETVDLIRNSPWYPSTDPAVPVYSHGEIEQRLRRIMNELEQ